MRSSSLSTVATVVVVALVAAGCGLLGRPSVSSQEEVIEALQSLQGQGVQMRLTADMTVDETEVRNALASNPDALALFAEEFAEGETDVDAVLAELAEFDAELDRHAVLVESGTDGSARFAVESDDQVWADVRALPTLSDDGMTMTDLRLQLAVDLQTMADVFESDELQGFVDEMSASASGLEEMVGPELYSVVDALINGELVEIGGDIAQLLEDMAGSGDAGATLDTQALSDAFDPAAFAEAALLFDNFRVEDGSTVVDVTINVRAAGEYLLDVSEALGDQAMSAADRAQAEADLEELPEQLVDVIQLRLSSDAVLEQVRVDVVDMVLQIGEAADPTDEDLAIVSSLASELEETGLFLVADITGVGATATVMGEATTTTTFTELFGAVTGMFLGGMGMDVDSAFPDVEEMTEEEMAELFGEDGGDPFPSFGGGLTSADVTIGDCFSDDVLYGFEELGSTSCEAPHANEVFAQIVLPEGDLAEVSFAQEGCYDPFESYVGTDYFESEFFIGMLVPSQEDWDAGDRTGLCYLFGFEDLTGSMAGSGR